MQQQNITNILLSIIAVLLLIMVLQNQGPRQASYNTPAPAYPEQQQASQVADPHAGHNHAPGAHEAAGNFNPSEMVYAALICPSDNAIPLSSPSCAGSEADARKATVDQGFEKGLSISKVFDSVIANYSLTALTEEAQEIIKARKK